MKPTLLAFVLVATTACGASHPHNRAPIAQPPAGADDWAPLDAAAAPRDASDPDVPSVTAAPPVVAARVASIVVGGFETCARLEDGTVRCARREQPQRTITGLANVTQLAIGYGHACALLRDGTARCWGGNRSGQLGDGTTEDTDEPAPVFGLEHAAQVEVGDTHGCARMEDGTVRCWGANDSGETGTGGNALPTTRPSTVPRLEHVTDIALGAGYTCALLANGTARCWGRNDVGQLGDGSTTERRTPVAVRGLTGAARIFAGSERTCAVLRDGTVRCWGANYDGRLGSSRAATAATAVRGLSAVAEVGSHEACQRADANTVTGCHQVSCARHTDGTVRCWGALLRTERPVAASGELPAPIAGVTGADQLSVAGDHAFAIDACARSADGVARCWGYEPSSLVEALTTHRPTPTPW